MTSHDQTQAAQGEVATLVEWLLIVHLPLINRNHLMGELGIRQAAALLESQQRRVEEAESDAARRQEEVARLRQALERCTTALHLAYSKKPLRDMAETLAEASAVLARQPSDKPCMACLQKQNVLDAIEDALQRGKP